MSSIAGIRDKRIKLKQMKTHLRSNFETLLIRLNMSACVVVIRSYKLIPTLTEPLCSRYKRL